ncbi:MAG: lipoyl(octanoyl) transferase LipB [Cytophagaceae bacterium]|jgi:lipoyl(octanoyl) transferase|nr:lipoyl(octanoyl) transferase LipB [Cytophagaceae bacterium]
MEILFKDLGTVDYQKAWDYQEKLFKETLTSKLENRNHSSNTKLVHHQLIFCEHPHVYTMGKSGVQSNLLISNEQLENIGAQFYRINRGGDITYHGPGQIVGYPIFDLEIMQLGIKEYVYQLEEAIIRTLGDMYIPASRLKMATGVWLDADNASKARKICAIGVRASRFVTMHGFALNVNTNLAYFKYINPCGFIDKGVTSIEKELGVKQSMDTVKKLLLKYMREVFNADIAPF